MLEQKLFLIACTVCEGFGCFGKGHVRSKCITLRNVCLCCTVIMRAYKQTTRNVFFRTQQGQCVCVGYIYVYVYTHIYFFMTLILEQLVGWVRL